jgi:diguanylate cyclase (GGDEF)-like protein
MSRAAAIATAGEQSRTGIHLLSCKGTVRDQQVHADRSHQKFLHASLLEKLSFIRRTPSVFMTWLLFSLVVALIGWGVLLANLKDTQLAVQARALKEASALARTHAERLSRSLDVMDQVARHARLEWQLANGELDLRKLREDGLFTAPLQYDVTLFNHDGVPVTSTSPNIWAAPVQDRDYFIALRDASGDPLSMSAPGAGTLGPPNVLNIARRLTDDSGLFAGVVLVSVANDFFTANYDPTVLGAHGLLGMLSDDHTVEVLRVGDRLLAPEQHAFRPTLRLPASNGSSRVAAQVFEDRRARYLGWHPVRGYDITALVGLDEADTLAQYYAGRHSAIWYATWATVALAVLAVLATVLSAELAWRKHRLGMAQATYRLATEEGSEGFYIVRPVRDRQGTVVDFTVLDCNQQGAEFFNVRPQELVGRSVSAFRGNVDTGMFIDCLLQATENGVYESEIEVPGNTALRLRWAHLKIIRSGENLAVRLRDVSEAKAHVAELKRRGNEDMLTGLPNRHWIQGFLPEALHRAQQENEHLALLFIDLDNFKKVNDTAGHAAGDELLKHAAQRLQEAVRPHDKVVRFGGDEFVVIVEDIAHRMDAAHVAERIGVAFRQSFRLSQGVHAVGTSIGIAMFPTDGADASTLLEKADIAMYSVKTSGKGGYQFYEAKFYNALRDRLDREVDLRRAIARDEFLMMYQPRVDILSGLTLSMEALVRWRHPTRGLLEPAEFIHMAEDTGMIIELGALVIEKVCAQIARWSEAGGTLVPVSINVSPQQFSGADVGSMLVAALGRHKVPPELIELEITESSVMDQDATVARTLSLLQKQGIKILVDDFGTGYSSLSQLHRLDFDVLKVDQAFTANIESSDEGMVFFTAIITMAHALGMRVVAEGVENLAQVRLLRSLDCDEVQGYYISEPLPAGDSQPVLPPCSFPTAYGSI